MRKLTTEEFIRRAKEVQGDYFDYSQVKYDGYDAKVCIICPEHGEFWQLPGNHLRGMGCPECANNIRLNTATFINRALEVHGFFFDYSIVEYKNNRTPVIIICPIHGKFEQIPSVHLKGCGCPKCKSANIGAMCKKDLDSFISDAIKIHGNKYSYIDAEYKGSHIPIRIYCPIHGYFWQTPTNHLSGCGCPKCRESKGEKAISKWLNHHGLLAIRQYRIKPQMVLFGRNTFIVDFFMPSLNTIIEFHGEQHYRRIKTWQNEEKFEKQQDRDCRLREHCKQQGITLIEIPYTEFENIDKILSKKIKVKP